MCGIFALFSNKTVNLNILFNIFSHLKHRGSDSFGIDFIHPNNRQIESLKSITPFQPLENPLSTCAAILHNRYSTNKNKSDFISEIQPIQFKNNHLSFSLVHNGHIANANQYINYEDLPIINTDTQNIIHFFHNATLENFESTIIDFIKTVHCSYSMCILINETIYAFRDSYGYKPLLFGKINDNYCFSSENNIPNFSLIRDVKPGEIIKLDSSGFKTIHRNSNPLELKCVFELIYFMNEKSHFNQHNIYETRINLGTQLAKSESIQFNKNETIVVGSPNTAIPMGKGFATYLDLPYEQVFKKKSDCGRTFILKTQKERLKQLLKFDFNKERIKNKIIILVDDSIVRGNTLQSISALFIEFGCKELHVRICSPELKYPCFYGIDIPTKKELIMNNYSISELEKKLGIESIRFLSINELINTFKNDNGFCLACFDGNYNKKLEW